MKHRSGTSSRFTDRGKTHGRRGVTLPTQHDRVTVLQHVSARRPTCGLGVVSTLRMPVNSQCQMSRQPSITAIELAAVHGPTEAVDSRVGRTARTHGSTGRAMIVVRGSFRRVYHKPSLQRDAPTLVRRPLSAHGGSLTAAGAADIIATVAAAFPACEHRLLVGGELLLEVHVGLEVRVECE